MPQNFLTRLLVQILKGSVIPKLHVEVSHNQEAFHRASPDTFPLVPKAKGEASLYELFYNYPHHCWVWHGSSQGGVSEDKYAMNYTTGEIELKRPQPFITVQGKRFSVRHLLASFKDPNYNSKSKREKIAGCIDPMCVNPHHWINLVLPPISTSSETPMVRELHPDSNIQKQIEFEGLDIDPRYYPHVYLVVRQERSYIAIGLNQAGAFSLKEVRDYVYDFIKEKPHLVKGYSIEDFLEYSGLDEETVLGFWSAYPKKFKELFYDSPNS